MVFAEHRSIIVWIDHSIVAISPFRVDVPSSSERIRLNAQTSGAETNDEVELRKVLGPAGLSMGQDFGGGEIFQIFVVHNNVDRSTGMPRRLPKVPYHGCQS